MVVTLLTACGKSDVKSGYKCIFMAKTKKKSQSFINEIEWDYLNDANETLSVGT